MEERGLQVMGRFAARPRGRQEDDVVCREDAFWFRPAYAGGTCPICGAAAPGGAPQRPWRRRARSWLKG